jgi:hypothetical protein
MAVTSAIASPSFGATVTPVETIAELRDAIRAANLNPDLDIILLAEGTYAFANTSSALLGPSVLPPITSPINIIGEGRDQTILDARQRGRIFTIQGGRLVLRRLTLKHGALSTGQGVSGGGAALLVSGTLQIEHCTISDSSVSAGAAGAEAAGGAVLMSGGKLRLLDTVLSNNTASIGGAIAVTGSSDTATFRRVIMAGNVSTGGMGGGLYLGKAKALISDSTIRDNRAASGSTVDPTTVGGGGIFNSGSLDIARSAIVTNSATPIGSGGGIFNAGTLTMRDSTLAANHAGTFGGGLRLSSPSFPDFIPRAGAKLENVTLVQNDVLGNVSSCDFTTTCVGGGGVSWQRSFNLGLKSLKIENTMIAENRIAPSAPSPFGVNCDFVAHSLGHNLLGDRQCLFLPSLQRDLEDLRDVTPLLAPLTDDGVPGHAHLAPLSGSPAIDGVRAGTDPSAPGSCSGQTDQLGGSRTDGDGDGQILCDIGAVESPMFPGRPVTWAKEFGKRGLDEVARLAEFEGFIYVAGRGQVPLSGPNRPPDSDHLTSFVRKYNAKGTLIWSRNVSLLSRTSIFDLAVDTSGIYIIGATDKTEPPPEPGDAFVIKYDFDGNEVWRRGLSRPLDGFFVEALSVVVTEGDVFVAGGVAGVTERAFVARLTAEGVLLWMTVLPDTDDASSSLAVHGARVYLLSNDIFVLNMRGREIKRLDIHSGPLDPPSNFQIGVNNDGIFVGGQFLRRFDFDGNELWRQSLLVSRRLRIVDDAILLCGGPFDNALAAIQEFGTDGEPRATRLLGVPGFGSCADLDVVEDGIVVGGATRGVIEGQQNKGDTDAYVARIPRLTSSP